jgi:hypothetical protein
MKAPSSNNSELLSIALPFPDSWRDGFFGRTTCLKFLAMVSKRYLVFFGGKQIKGALEKE